MSTTTALTTEIVEDAIGPLDRFAKQCHAASLALVQSGVLGDGARVARGTVGGIGGQHSWAVVGNPYLPERIVDVTAWSYGVQRQDVPVPRVWESRVAGRSRMAHRPHGAGSIWDSGVPVCGSAPDVPLEGLTGAGQAFLAMVASANSRTGLDVQGWAALMSSPVQGWPAGEIMLAMNEHPRLKGLVPIDRLGMLTEENPAGMYF